MSLTSFSTVQPVSILAMSSQPSVAENTSFIIIGFLFVVVVLSILATVTSIIGFGFKQADKKNEATALALKPTARPVPAPAAAASAPYSSHETPEHIPVLIAAAAHTFMHGKPHRIVSIRNVNQRWAQEGRREIFSSHKLR